MRFGRLGDLAEINPRPRGRPSDDEMVSFLRMADLDAETGTTTRGAARRFGTVSKGYTNFEDGDLLLAKITPCFENGKIGQARLAHRLGAGSTEFHIIRPDPSVMDSRFVLHFLRDGRVRLDGASRMTGSAGQRRVPEAFIAELQVPLYPLDEQHRLANMLDRANALRAKRRESLTGLDDLAESIFADMFGESRRGADWRLEPLARVVATDTIVTYGIVQAGEEFSGGVPYIRTGDIAHGEILTRGLRHTAPEIAARFQRSTVHAGEIVMSIRATVGTTAIVPRELDGANLTQGTARIAPGAGVTALYLLHYLRSPAVQHWISRQIKGATFLEITLTRLRELPVLVPPVALQRQFDSAASVVQTLRRQGTAHLDLLDELSASIQGRVFRGAL